MMKYLTPQQNQTIQQLLRSCGQQVETMAAETFEVFQKGVNDYVTSIDQMLDRYLLSAFSDLFPQDTIITEENPESQQAFRLNPRRAWMIDPLDGTEEFIQRGADYAVMVGLLQEARPVAGWVYAPTRDRVVYGGTEWGLFSCQKDEGPQTLAVIEPPPPTPDFCPLIIGSRDRRNFGSAIAQLIPEGQFYSLGSFGLKVLEVIEGRAGLYLYLNGRVKLWDTTGPLALAQAAGLTCCDLMGEPIQFTPDAVNLETLAHYQPIVVGWPTYVEALRSKIAAAVELAATQAKKV
jgi:3'(2'), 5'-bisphosphate nucleotidase